MKAIICAALASFVIGIPISSARGQDDSGVTSRGDSISIRLVDVDVRMAVQLLSQYLDRAVVIASVPLGSRVTLETPRPVLRKEVLPLLRGLLSSQNLDLVSDSASGLYRLSARQGPIAPGPQSSASRSIFASAQPQELFVIRLRHARATDVANTVNALYGRASALGDVGEKPSSLSRQLQQNQIPPAEPPVAQAVPGAVGRTAALAGDVTIVPDVPGNSLLIRASRADFELIQAAVEELDVRPLQVLIEVLIAEVRKDRALDFGVDVSLPATSPRGMPQTAVQGDLTGAGSGIGLGDLAIKVMRLGPSQIDATLQAAASRGDVTIVSRPILLAANNEKAEINVGSQRPFVQVSRVLPTDNTARDQVVQYKDVGTRLSIMPTISADGYVMLQILQEINAATAEQEFSAPVISTRSVDTKLLIHDGQTIVLGGLTDDERSTTQAGVPILSSIPLVGGLFGHYNRATTKTELLLFLTPRVIHDDADVDDLTSPLKQRAARVPHE